MIIRCILAALEDDVCQISKSGHRDKVKPHRLIAFMKFDRISCALSTLTETAEGADALSLSHRFEICTFPPS